MERFMRLSVRGLAVVWLLCLSCWQAALACADLQPRTIRESVQAADASLGFVQGPAPNVGLYWYDAQTETAYLVEAWYDPDPFWMLHGAQWLEQSDVDFAGGAGLAQAGAQRPEALADCGSEPPAQLPPMTVAGRVPLPRWLSGFFLRLVDGFVAGFVGRNAQVVHTIEGPEGYDCGELLEVRFAMAVQRLHTLILASRPGQVRAGQVLRVGMGQGQFESWMIQGVPGSLGLAAEPLTSPCSA